MQVMAYEHRAAEAHNPLIHQFINAIFDSCTGEHHHHLHIMCAIHQLTHVIMVICLL